MRSKSRKLKVGVIFGGRSAEHEVSLQSAKNVIQAINKDKYDIILIGIDKDGRWHLQNQSAYLLNESNPKLIKLNASTETLAIVPGQGASPLMPIATGEAPGKIDVAFPVLHGTFGEDGTVQGLLKLLDIPFVGASILGSSVGMDKDVMKRLLRDAGLPLGKFHVYYRQDGIASVNFSKIESELGLPVFVKPANAGSSVGVSKARTKEELLKAVSHAFEYDSKILVEEFIPGREIECAVLGNHSPIASIPGEIIPHHEFYSYEAKYIDADGAGLEIPAKLTGEQTKEMQRIAVETFKTLCCEGMGRVDCFLTKEGKIYVNEINTIPGFTKISMYPKLWAATGISYEELIERLLSLAIERFEEEQRSKTSFEA